MFFKEIPTTDQLLDHQENIIIPLDSIINFTDIDKDTSWIEPLPTKPGIYIKGQPQPLIEPNDNPYYIDEDNNVHSIKDLSEILNTDITKYGIYVAGGLVIDKTFHPVKSAVLSDCPVIKGINPHKKALIDYILRYLVESFPGYQIFTKTSSGISMSEDKEEEINQLIEDSDVIPQIDSFIADAEFEYITFSSVGTAVEIIRGIDFRVYEYTKNLENKIIGDLTSDWQLHVYEKGSVRDYTFEMFCAEYNINYFKAYNKLNLSDQHTFGNVKVVLSRYDTFPI